MSNITYYASEFIIARILGAGIMRYALFLEFENQEHGSICTYMPQDCTKYCSVTK